MKRTNTRTGAAQRSRCIFILLSITLCIPILSAAEKPERPPPQYPGGTINLAGGYVTNRGFVDVEAAGTAFTNESIRNMAVSIGQLGGVNPETGDIIINKGNLLPLVAQELDTTGPAYFYTNVYVAGDTFIYGTLYGSGSGITNISASSIFGSLVDRPDIQTALESKLDADGVWVTIHGNAAAISNLLQSVFTLEQASPNWNAAYLWGNHADAGYASGSELDVHRSTTNNPHQINPAQIGALPETGGRMHGHIDMSGDCRITNLPDPANNQDAVPKSYLEKRLNYIPPQGDLEMGVYTNQP